MPNNFIPVPKPLNEPILSYGPGTPEKALLKAEIKRMLSEEIEIPLIIGGKEVRTGNTAKARLAAYALFKLSASNDPSSENKATQNLAKHAATLTPQELEAGQALARELAQSKDMAKTLSPYLDKASAQAVKATAKPTPKPRPAKSKPAAGATSGG